MQIELVHSLPGRMRLRIPGLRVDVNCRLWIEKTLASRSGLTRFRINIWCEALVLEGDDSALGAIIALFRTTVVLTPAAEPAHAQAGAAKWRWLRSPLLAASAGAALSLAGGGTLAAVCIPFVLFGGMRSARNAWRVVRSERRLNVDFLDTVAIAVSLARGQFFTAAAIAWLIALGDWIRDRTAAQSKRAISRLLEFQGVYAWVVSNGSVTRVPSRMLHPGDEVIVYPGETIPVDGRILRGRATVDQKIVTGESLPSEKSPGEDVYASTLVREGKLVLQAVRVGDDTTAAQIVRLVDAAPMGETRIQNHAEKLGDRLVAPSLLLSGGLFAMTGNVDRLLSMLIVDFGTGIRVAAPTSMLAAMAHAARNGILIKSGHHMEQLAALDTIVFDKTGTLTHGRPEIGEVMSFDERLFPARTIMSLAAAAEARLKHPVSEAIVTKAEREGLAIPDRSASDFQVGLGVQAQVNGYVIHLGNDRFLSRCGVHLNGCMRHVRDVNQSGSSALLFAVDGEVKGVIPYADQVRGDSGPVIQALRGFGVRKVVMITGDNATVAEAVSRQLQIDAFYADMLPADKAEIVKDLQRRGHAVAMVGDGINDSPALAHADVGVSLKHGADVARETADVVLMHDSLWKLVSAVEISKSAVRNVKQNYAMIAGLNSLALLLAIPTGLVSPNVSALISNGSAILASLNSIRPLLER